MAKEISELKLGKSAASVFGLGQEDDLELADPEQHYRIERFIQHLRECKETVAFLGLTLDSLMTKVILPERDQPIFIRLMQEALGIGSTQEQFADRL